MRGTRLRLLMAGAGAAVMAAGGGVWLSGTAAAAPVRAVAAVSTAAHARPRHGDRDDHGWHRDRRSVLSARLAPSMPGDPAVFGVMPGKLPWKIKTGHVRLAADGALNLRVTGLVVPSTGKNPLSQVAAVVFCGGTQAAATAPVPFSAKGDAHVRARVALPAFCPAPAVLVEPVTGTTLDNMYIAFDGTAMK